MTDEEDWRPVSGYEGLYEVSNLGRVKSLNRTFQRRGTDVRVRERVMKLGCQTARSGHLVVTLRKGNKPTTRYVHRLVCEAFNGKPPEGKPFALHRNDNPSDNTPENLYWGDARDNARDMIQNGLHSSCGITHCPRGHTYTEETTYRNPQGYRSCRVCRLQEQKKRKELPCPEKYHGTLTGYSSYGCRCSPCEEVRNEYTRQYRSR